MLTENLKNIPAGAQSKTKAGMWFSPFFSVWAAMGSPGTFARMISMEGWSISHTAASQGAKSEVSK